MNFYQPPLDLTLEEILLYLRKSQSDDPTLSIEEVLEKHETLLDEWAEKNLDGKVPEKNRFREVVSGETLSDRPEINKVLKMIESPKYRAIMIVEPQRLTRGDYEDIGRVMKLLKHTNTLIITLTRIYDLRDEYDWDAFEMELKRGNDYLKYYKKIQLRGKLLSLSQGNYISSKPPYGFNKIYVMDGKRKCPTLEENKEQADIVRTIFDLFVNHNYGKRRICKYLDDAKIKPPKGQYWSPSSVKIMLCNIHYIGKVHWNWRKTVIEVEDGQFVKKRPFTNIEEHLVYEGKHDGIISEELFYAAQEKMGKEPKVQKNAKLRNPFAGIIYCKKCGRSMIYKQAKTKEGKVLSEPRLMCPETHNCGLGSCLFDEMIDRVASILEECIEDFEFRIKNDAGDSLRLHAELIKNLEKKMSALKAKELSQWEMQSDPDPAKRMPNEIFQRLNEKLLKEKDEVQQALCKAYESMPEPVDYEERVGRFKEALERLKDPEADPEAKNNLLKSCIERIDYHREKFQRIDGKWNSPMIEMDVRLKV